MLAFGYVGLAAKKVLCLAGGHVGLEALKA
jgi:hypothetical protein